MPLDHKNDPRGPEELDAAFVCMPFATAFRPSIGLELVRASAPFLRAKSFYFTLPFARTIGEELYQEICVSLQFEWPLVGEWIWSADLKGTDPEDDSGFFTELSPQPINARRPPGELVDGAWRARRESQGFLDDCVRQVEKHRPRLVGFTSTFQQHVASLALAQRLKERRPDLFVVFGGANCEGVMGLETVRRFPFVDAVVSGEADVVFPELVRRVLAGRAVDDLEGVCTRANAEGLDRMSNAPRALNLDALPRPDYGDFFTTWRETGLEKRPDVPFETSRGCWWGERQHCTFCGLNGSSMAFRSKSAEKALAELEEITVKYPGSPVNVVDNILDMKYFKDFLPALAEKKLGVELFYEVKANLRKDQLQKLRDAGVTSLLPGVESFSDDVLKRMKKGVRGLENVQLLKWCAELGLSPRWYLIWGFPGEPPEEYARMAEWVPLLTHLPPPKAAGWIQLHRFSPNFERAAEFGFKNVGPHPAYRHVYDLPPEALSNLAYLFTFEYQDGRDVGRYTGGLGEGVLEWQQVYEKSDLVYAEEGGKLWLWDLRPAARQPLTRLDGLARSLYLACDQVRPIAWLARHGGKNGDLTAGQVEDVLGPLVEAGLMLRDGDRVLSLAVPGGQRTP